MKWEQAVFDTDVLIRYSEGDMRARNVFLQVRRRVISEVTWIEFLVGIAPAERQAYKVFLQNNFTAVVCDRAISEIAIDIRHRIRMKLPDATIYATAKYLKAPILTFNKKHFDKAWPDIYIPE